MFDKLDAYNLVANLVPGAALAYALNLSDFPTPPPSDILAFLLAAFVAGVTVNRLGSLVLDPLLRWKRLPFHLKPKDYKSFVTSERDDPKLEILVANAGLYRTFLSGGLVYFVLMALDYLVDFLGFSTRSTLWVSLVIAMIVFLFALRKEDDYIHQRLSMKAGED
tara:strand:+ start:158 stop:652 length:495 start_codon:yes stop_codon:yes gene_type:complete